MTTLTTNWSSYTARDFTSLPYVSYTGNHSKREAIVIIHGITAELDHQKKFAETCKRKADIFLPILRGYDQSPKRGDIDYIGQYDDDLLDFIHYVEKKGYESIVLVGHSMGCANILRLIKKNPLVAAEYIFVAPFFHPTIPVYHNDATEQSKEKTDVDYMVYDKKVALLMTLYKMNISRFNNRAVAEIPDEFHHSGRLSLSFRLLVSRFLERVPSDLFEHIQGRVSIYVGDDDEVIQHEKLKRWVEKTWGEKVQLIEGADHNHILHDTCFHNSLVRR